MELNLNQPMPFKNISLPLPETYLSTEAASTLLSKRKVVEFDRDFGSNERWQTAALIVFTASLMGGFWAFISWTLEDMTHDFSGDVLTPYKCYIAREPDYSDQICRNPFYAPYRRDSDGYIYNHTRHEMVYSYSRGLKAGISTAFVPPFLIGLGWIILKLSTAAYRVFLKKDADAYNRHLSDMIIALKNGSVINEQTATPPSLVPNLIAHQLTEEEHYKLLSFEQIQAIKNDKRELFETLVNDQAFSEEQQKNLEVLDKLLHAKSPEELATDLAINENRDIFRQEPKILEVLIRKVPEAHLIDRVKSLLSLNLKDSLQVFEQLRLENITEIVELMAKNNYSFEVALNNFQMLSTGSHETVSLQFSDASREMPKHLLLTISPYFNALFNDFESQNDSVTFENIESKYFEEILSYFTTGTLTYKKIEELLPLWEVANYFEIVKLPWEIDSFISSNFLSEESENELHELLSLGTRLKLTALPKAIDVKMSYNLASKEVATWFFKEEFLEDLALIRQFCLYESLRTIADLIASNLEELLKESRAITQLAKAIQIHDKMFSALTAHFDKRPDFLKQLWDEANLQKNEIVQDVIVRFCDNPDNLHLILVNWDLPPKIKNSRIEFKEEI